MNKTFLPTTLGKPSKVTQTVLRIVRYVSVLASIFMWNGQVMGQGGADTSLHNYRGPRNGGSDMSDYMPSEYFQRIQELVDRLTDIDPDVEIAVVGSVPEGRGRNVFELDRPMGKDPSERSDIDYTFKNKHGGSKETADWINDLFQGQCNGCKGSYASEFPGMDRWGMFFGDPKEGSPHFLFRPNQPPEFVNKPDLKPIPPAATCEGMIDTPDERLAYGGMNHAYCKSQKDSLADYDGSRSKGPRLKLPKAAAGPLAAVLAVLGGNKQAQDAINAGVGTAYDSLDPVTQAGVDGALGSPVAKGIYAVGAVSEWATYGVTGLVETDLSREGFDKWTPYREGPGFDPVQELEDSDLRDYLFAPYDPYPNIGAAGNRPSLPCGGVYCY